MKKNLDIFQKYAFNLNEKKKYQEIEKKVNVAFKKQQKGIYDDLENNDLKIKEIKNKLNEIKSKSIKEHVYSHFKIPDTWKNKIGYQNNMLNIFSEDVNFTSYMGKGGEIKKKNINDSDDKSSFSKTSNNFFPKININDSNLIEKNHNKKIESFGQISFKNKFSKIKQESEKEILSILEEYKNAFPIKKETLLTEINTNNDTTEKENYEKKVNKTFTSNFYNKNNNTKIKNKKKTLLNYLDHLPLTERQESFRKSIYTNFIPNTSLNSNKKKSMKKKKNLLLNTEESKFGPFLDSNYILFNKKIDINNPILKKHLESINYYGPYYSYCPPCRNDNINFYKDLDLRKAIQLIQFIKKNKGKSIIENESNYNLKDINFNDDDDLDSFVDSEN